MGAVEPKYDPSLPYPAGFDPRELLKLPMGKARTKQISDQWARLPADVIRNIFSTLGAQDIEKLSRVNQRFRGIILNDPHLATKLQDGKRLNRLGNLVANNLKAEVPDTLSQIVKSRPQPPNPSHSYADDTFDSSYRVVKYLNLQNEETLSFVKPTRIVRIPETVEKSVLAKIEPIWESRTVKKAGVFSKEVTKEHTFRGFAVTFAANIDETQKKVIQEQVDRLNDSIKEQHEAAGTQLIAAVKQPKGSKKKAR